MPKCRDYGGLCDGQARDFAVALAPCDTCAALLRAGPGEDETVEDETSAWNRREIKARMAKHRDLEYYQVDLAYRAKAWELPPITGVCPGPAPAEPSPPLTAAEARRWMMAHPMQVLVESWSDSLYEWCLRFNPSVGFEACEIFTSGEAGNWFLDQPDEDLSGYSVA